MLHEMGIETGIDLPRADRGLASGAGGARTAAGQPRAVGRPGAVAEIGRRSDQFRAGVAAAGAVPRRRDCGRARSRWRGRDPDRAADDAVGGRAAADRRGVIAALILTMGWLAPLEGPSPRAYHSMLLVTGLIVLAGRAAAAGRGAGQLAAARGRRRLLDVRASQRGRGGVRPAGELGGVHADRRAAPAGSRSRRWSAGCSAPIGLNAVRLGAARADVRVRRRGAAAARRAAPARRSAGQRGRAGHARAGADVGDRELDRHRASRGSARPESAPGRRSAPFGWKLWILRDRVRADRLRRV